jgi:endo-1,4-beta-xylanase
MSDNEHNAWTRRQSLAAILSLGVAACGGYTAPPATSCGQPPMIPPPPSPPPPPLSAISSLNDLAKRKGMRFGSVVGAGNAASGSFRNPNYAKLLEADCGILVGENEMKWQAIRPSSTSYDFAQFDEMMAYAASKNLPMRGHNLLWHRPEWMPTWLENYDFGSRPATEAERLLTEHITTVCAHYRGRIKSYDVVNETVLGDGSLSATAISRAMGGTTPLLDLAFRTARAQAPDAQLVYNDYMSWETGNEGHRSGVLRLLEGFKARGVPVDALGIQAHISIYNYDPASGNSGPRQETEWRKFLDEVTGMGYDLLITELDVNDQNLPADIVTRDNANAAYARDYLDLMFSYRQLKDVLVWGLCSWLQSFQPLRADKLPKRPAPYDAAYQPKPLYRAIAAAIEAAPAR